MEIKLGTLGEIDLWMKLVEKVRAGFPGLETSEALEEHKDTVLQFINRQEAICAKDLGQIVGVLLFSKQENMLCFLAVDKAYRRQHIAEKMVSYMLGMLDPQRDVAVSTYREDVPEGHAARAFYKHLGFQAGELTEEFGSPVQVFVLKREMRIDKEDENHGRFHDKGSLSV